MIGFRLRMGFGVFSGFGLWWGLDVICRFGWVVV